MKRHLVIFGEYVPFEPFLRGLIDFFNMPMSSVNPGNSNQPLFKFNESNILGLICFDIAFPLSFIKEIKATGFIVNISNDTWFGDSYGPYQHLQIVRARALEANKWVARGTSDGISAIIDNKGTIVEILPKGISGVIKAKIFSIENDSFFYEIGYLIIPLLSFIVLISTYILRFII
jgi:apolipoprotein N-acyltransferase